METMTLKEVCKVLRISEGTARNRLSSGLTMPPSFKIGRHRLFLTVEFRKWIQEQENSHK
jgi:predicted site-specific integrase-resolvase